MPYIKEAKRSKLDSRIEDLTDQLDSADWTGDLNYCITKMIIDMLGEGFNYDDLNSAIGVLECAKQELYRRYVSPYEDKKIKENGDVYTMKGTSL